MKLATFNAIMENIQQGAQAIAEDYYALKLMSKEEYEKMKAYNEGILKALNLMVELEGIETE